MRQTRGFRWQIALVVMLIARCSAWAAPAPEGAFRGFVSLSNPEGEENGVFPVPGFGSVPANLEGDSATGLAVYWEYRMGKKLGLDLGFNFTKYTINTETSFGDFELGDALALTIPVGLNIHFLDGKAVGLYVGPFVQFTAWGNLETSVGESEIDPDFGVGAAFGVDVPIGGSGFMFNAALRYMMLELGDPSLTIPIDPLLIDVGFGYRW